jgi:thiol:disulfide interchange protein
LVVIEAKTNSDKPTPHQRAWLDHFRQYGAEVYVFYPKDQQTMEKVLE